MARLSCGPSNQSNQLYTVFWCVGSDQWWGSLSCVRGFLLLWCTIHLLYTGNVLRLGYTCPCVYPKSFCCSAIHLWGDHFATEEHDLSEFWDTHCGWSLSAWREAISCILCSLFKRSNFILGYVQIQSIYAVGCVPGILSCMPTQQTWSRASLGYLTGMNYQIHCVICYMMRYR